MTADIFYDIYISLNEMRDKQVDSFTNRLATVTRRPALFKNIILFKVLFVDLLRVAERIMLCQRS